MKVVVGVTDSFPMEITGKLMISEAELEEFEVIKHQFESKMAEVKNMLGGGQGDGQLLNQDEQF